MTSGYITEYNEAIRTKKVRVGKWIEKIYSLICEKIESNEYFFDAEKAGNAFNAKICGVDIIIDDVEKEKYSIIEINDNPGYSINEWPYEGEGEKIGIAILDLLDILPSKD